MYNICRGLLYNWNVIENGKLIAGFSKLHHAIHFVWAMKKHRALEVRLNCIIRFGSLCGAMSKPIQDAAQEALGLIGIRNYTRTSNHTDIVKVRNENNI